MEEYMEAFTDPVATLGAGVRYEKEAVVTV